jgi:hypothetical protein
MGGSFPFTKHVAPYIGAVAKIVTGRTSSCFGIARISLQ